MAIAKYIVRDGFVFRSDNDNVVNAGKTVELDEEFGDADHRLERITPKKAEPQKPA